MLTHLTVDQIRTVMRLAERAQAAEDRLLDRAHQVDLAASTEPAARERPDQQAWSETADALRDTGLTGPVQNLDSALARLTPEARCELHAIALIGRGDYAARQWEDAVAAAQAVSDESQPRMLADMDALQANLAKGLYELHLT